MRPTVRGRHVSYSPGDERARPVQPARALSPAARRPRSRSCARDAQGHRLHGRGPLEADHRRRHDLDRDDAVQLQPARAGGEGQGRDPGGRRHADGVQHDLGLRWGLDGNRGNEGLARVARGDRGLDRAGRTGTPVRWSRVPGRMRQDVAGCCDGAGAPRPAWPGPLQRHDPSRRAARETGRHGRDRIRGDRRVSGREDQPRRAAGDRGRGLPRSRRVRRPIHREHDEHRPGVPGAQPRRPERDSGSRSGKARCRGDSRAPRDGARQRGDSPVGRS